MTVGFGLIGAGQMAHIHAVAITEQTPGRARIVAVAGGTRAPALAAISTRRARKQWTDSSLVVPSYAILATPY